MPTLSWWHIDFRTRPFMAAHRLPHSPFCGGTSTSMLDLLWWHIDLHARSLVAACRLPPSLSTSVHSTSHSWSLYHFLWCAYRPGAIPPMPELPEQLCSSGHHLAQSLVCCVHIMSDTQLEDFGSSSFRFREICEPDPKSGSSFGKFCPEPDRTRLQQH
jgi:hypothetical protein